MVDSTPVTTLDFLRAIHGDMTEGVVETRVLSDVAHEAPIDRAWFGTIDALVNDLQRQMQMAEARRAGIFFGVLRRREIGQGKNEHAMPGWVVWADLDFKDYAGGEPEARERLGKFSAKPSIVVRTAHGLHVYWILSAALDPGQISELCKSIADILGGDSVHDAARILRLPGTYNRKDPANPVLVEIETFEPENRHDIRNLKAAIAMAKPQSSGAPKPPPPGGPPPPPRGPAANGPVGAMSDRVQALVRSNKRIGNMFFGVGKPKVGNKGQSLDTSSSGYDYSFVAVLVQESVLDPEELVAALMNRPDGHARGKGQKYAAHTVKTVLEKYGPRELNPYEQLQITKVGIYDSNPPVYEVTTQERTFRITADDLASVKKFRVAYLSATHTIPQLPAQDDWPQWVNLLLDRAERREMPPEASTEPALREAVLAAIDDLPITDALEELAAGKAFDLGDGRKGFREIAVRNRVKEDFTNIERQNVCRVLKELGYASSTHRIGDTTRRLWALVTAP